MATPSVVPHNPKICDKWDAKSSLHDPTGNRAIKGRSRFDILEKNKLQFIRRPWPGPGKGGGFEERVRPGKILNFPMRPLSKGPHMTPRLSGRQSTERMALWLGPLLALRAHRELSSKTRRLSRNF